MSDTIDPTGYDAALTDEDVRDLLSLGADVEQGITHSVLESWQRVLQENLDTRDGRVTPSLANRIVTTWPQLTFKQVPAYLKRYYDILQSYQDVLDDVIAKNPKALQWLLQEDAENNHDVYIEIVGRWQAIVIKLELDWKVNAPAAAVDLAAMDDANGYVMNPMEGLLSHLGVIGFAFREEDNAVIEALIAQNSEA